MTSPETVRRHPRTPLHHQLAWIWQEVLGCDRPNLDDDFFTLGGTSIKAVLCATEVNTRLRSRLSLISLFEAPVFEQFADMVRDGGSSAMSSLVMWPDAPGPCLVYIPSAWGQDFSAQRFLSPFGRRALALRPPGLEPGETPLADLEDLVAFALDELRAAGQREVFLVGYSSGGFIAYDVARRAAAEGFAVHGALLLDPGEVPDLGRMAEVEAAAIAEILDQVHRDRARQGDPAPAGSAPSAGSTSCGAAEALDEALRALGVEGDPLGHYRRRLGVFTAHVRALQGFVINPSMLPVTVVASEGADVAAWRRAVPGLTVVATQVPHADLLSDAALAEGLASSF
ncbi:alpha/beta fold hydrolase [Kitasatospora sp. MAP5-34]|uniref:alpha/beta fold hydrolase n=1 Tax=Kitasatospora sp. MAP5-34 TaxID=3035102 RepID=UPI002476B58E|nr:alpha/beta fold hydrolase [Kitasatospora sp. MAP5-34]MDH6578642.1 thioesterase domain-containing protein [Kitasatospora sp. MAP5-34]